MSVLIPQIADKTKEAKAGAAIANSIPELRDQVVKLAEALQEAEARIAKLEGRKS